MNPASPSLLPNRQSFWKAPATWLGILIYTLFCLFVFRDYLLAKSAIAFIGGDPVKNLFTYLYSAAYGGGSLRFSGMNYPFGEHLSFTDAQPLLALTVGTVQKYLHLSHPQLMKIMYAAIAGSFVLGMVYTQRLLQHFSVPPAFAILFSALILIMSPHIYRYTGHFGLAYASLLPMLSYWSVRYYQTNQNRYLLKLFLLLLVYAFLHLYFLGMVLLWSGAYFASAILLRRNLPGRPLTHALRYLLPVAGVLGVSKIFFALTDTITDRPTIPYSGGYEPGGGLNLLTSVYSPVWKALNKAGWVNHIHESSGEFCYLGIVPVAMLLVLGIGAATGFLKKWSGGQKSFAGHWLLTTALTLLFAVTVKYFWEVGPFEKLFAPLRQFRAPERFSWIAYYVLSVVAAVLLYRVCKYAWAGGWKVPAGTLGILAISVWMADASGAITNFHKDNKHAFNNGQFFFNIESSWKAHLAKQGYQPQTFSSLLTLPMVHVGSEKIWLREDASYNIVSAFKASLEMQLPIVDVYSSRTSWSQTFETVRLAGGPFANQSLWRSFPAEKAVLLSHYLDYPISPDEQALLQPGVADPIGEIDGCKLYVFWPQKWLRRQSEMKGEALQIAAVMKGTDTAENSSLPYFVSHFETAPTSTNSFAGSGSAATIKGGDSLFATLQLPQALETPAKYEFSAWTQYNATSYRSNGYEVKCFDSTGKELLVAYASGKFSTDNAPGMWFRVSIYFDAPAGTTYMEMKVQNPDGDSYRAMDEVLLRPAEALIISRFPNGTVLANNHLLKR